MSRVAVLGGRDAVLGFRASGAQAFVADTTDEARQKLEGILSGDFAILLVTEEVAKSLGEELARLYGRSEPVVTVLPDSRSGEGLGMELLRKRVERAVGANILPERKG